MPNPEPFRLRVPNVAPKNDAENAENWRRVIDWDQRLAPTGRTLLASQTIVTAGNLVTFANIPQNFNHLDLITNVGGDQGAQQQLFARFNDDATANYWWEVIATLGGGAPATFNAASQTQERIGNVAESGFNRTSYNRLHIPDYNKTLNHIQGWLESTTQGSLATQRYSGGIYWNTLGQAINKITIFPQAGNFNVGSTFYLYGEF